MCPVKTEFQNNLHISFKPPKLGLAPEFPKYERHEPGGLFTEYKSKRSQHACAGFKEKTQPQHASMKHTILIEPQKMD